MRLIEQNREKGSNRKLLAQEMIQLLIKEK